MEVYQQLLPLYFPRSAAEEAWALDRLPSDLGNEDGEPVVEERKITIMDRPLLGKRQDEGDGDEAAAADGGGLDDEDIDPEQLAASAFANMAGDHDSSRREKLATKISQEEVAQLEAQRRYQRWLKRARTGAAIQPHLFLFVMLTSDFFLFSQRIWPTLRRCG